MPTECLDEAQTETMTLVQVQDVRASQIELAAHASVCRLLARSAVTAGFLGHPSVYTPVDPGNAAGGQGPPTP
jgi:hypothetical protein